MEPVHNPIHCYPIYKIHFSIWPSTFNNFDVLLPPNNNDDNHLLFLQLYWLPISFFSDLFNHLYLHILLIFVCGIIYFFFLCIFSCGIRIGFCWCVCLYFDYIYVPLGFIFVQSLRFVLRLCVWLCYELTSTLYF